MVSLLDLDKQQRKSSLICQNIWNEIRFDIGTNFSSEEKHRFFVIVDCKLGNRKGEKLLLLEVQLMEPFPMEYIDKLQLETDSNNDEIQKEKDFFHNHYEDLVNAVYRYFSYLADVKIHFFLSNKKDGKCKLYINCWIFLKIDIDHVFLFSKKVKKSIIQFKDYYLNQFTPKYV